MTDRLRLATATGLPFLILAFHVATGIIAFVTGFVALDVRKGGVWHRRIGRVFVWAMSATGIAAVVVATIEGKPDNVSGLITAYFAFTAFTAVKPLAGMSRRVDIGLMLVVFAFAAAGYLNGITALGRPGNQIEGVPAGMMFFLATINLCAGIGDVRMIRAGGLQGSRRIARHLWRMCFALFIASGSFLLGQMQLFPAVLRNVPLLFFFAVSPLLMLLYWMWRVRLRQNLRGLAMNPPAATSSQARNSSPV